jgi:hypothetical protein
MYNQKGNRCTLSMYTYSLLIILNTYSVLCALRLTKQVAYIASSSPVIS